MSLFQDAPRGEPPPAPLAERLRPTSLAEVSGQEHLTGPDGALTRLLAAPTLGSMIFWGPPGSGKTTVARLIGAMRSDAFVQVSAIHSGVAELKKIFEAARARRAQGQGTLAVRRRDPPLQPRPAGFLPAGDGGRRRHADRRDHREPVVRAQRRASVPCARAGVPGADRGGARGVAAARRAPRRQSLAARRGGARRADRHGRRRRPRGADAGRGGVARGAAGRGPRRGIGSSTSCSGAPRSTTRRRTATTT